MEAVAAVLVKPLVRPRFIIRNPCQYVIPGISGRVAAGAVAEKYLKQVFGVEIVAFVSSVGKISIPSTQSAKTLSGEAPSEDDDETEDALTPEFRELLRTVTRELVDGHLTRCPHPETAERMTQVWTSSHLSSHDPN